MPTHAALLYRSDEDYLDALVPFVTDGLDAGEAVLVVVPAARAELLAGSLAGRAGQVDFVEAPTGSPATVIAGYRRLVDAHLGAGIERVRLIGEVEPGRGAAGHLARAQYEAAIGAAFTGTPVAIVCPYDVRVLPADLLRRIEHAHPELWRDGVRAANPRFTDPAVVLRSVQIGPLPVEEFPPALDLRIGPEISIPREALRGVAVRAGLGPDRLEDLLLAFTEVAANALVHGSSVAKAQVWASNGAVVCTVTDSGSGLDDPLAGLVPPSRGEQLDPGGLGLWVARQLCDTLDLVSGPAGLTVRFVVRR